MNSSMIGEWRTAGLQLGHVLTVHCERNHVYPVWTVPFKLPEVGFTVFMNVVGAVILIVLYSIDLKNASLLWMCKDSLGVSYNDGCRNLALLVQSLVTSMDTTLMVLAALLLVARLRFAVLGIRALSTAGEEMQVKMLSSHC
ncbi:hypothetical protein D4764_10G0010460 [Takifugu flavidus]|uniref:Uncharacterized protein n=1 Tax=Takifugu flavidus TaxID=433684 RepID=A0A5C6PM61_9TELE|nr:hypothetical protein D4764_10G0010460 [Takifugu flavidus]